MEWIKKLFGFGTTIPDSLDQPNLAVKPEATQIPQQKVPSTGTFIGPEGTLLPGKSCILSGNSLDASSQNLTASQKDFLVGMRNGLKELTEMFEQMKRELPFPLSDPTDAVIPNLFSLAVLGERDVVDSSVFSGKFFSRILGLLPPKKLNSQLTFFYGIIGYGLANQVALAFQSQTADDLFAVADIFGADTTFEGLLPLEIRFLSAPSRDGNIIPRTFALQKVASLENGRINGVNGEYQLQMEVASKNSEWVL